MRTLWQKSIRHAAGRADHCRDGSRIRGQDVGRSWRAKRHARGNHRTRLNHEINAGLANPTIKSRLAELCTIPLSSDRIVAVGGSSVEALLERTHAVPLLFFQATAPRSA